MDSYLVESLIVFTEVLEDFYILSFLFKLLTKSVYIDHKQCFFLFYADFLPPKMYNLDPIKVAQWFEIPY